jgi:hypothetical protein
MNYRERLQGETPIEGGTSMVKSKGNQSKIKIAVVERKFLHLEGSHAFWEDDPN